MEHLLIYEGKVRNIYQMGEKYLLMKASIYIVVLIGI